MLSKFQRKKDIRKEVEDLLDADIQASLKLTPEQTPAFHDPVGDTRMRSAGEKAEGLQE